MSTPSDGTPQVGPIWPPAPTHRQAPEEFAIEGFSIRRADALTVRNPKHRWKLFSILAVQFFIVGIGWMDSFRIWSNFHRQFGPPGPVWSDPFFRHQMELSTLTYTVIALCTVALFWFMSASVPPYGVTVFRPSGTVEVGRRSGRVSSVGIRRQAALRGITYITTVNMDTHGRPFWNRLRPMFTLQSLENAQRMAVTLAEFMDVPLTRSR